MWVEASSPKTVVKHSTLDSKVKGLIPARRDKTVKKVHVNISVQSTSKII
jgi:hypothetical protein